MKKSLRVLIIDSSEDDARLIVQRLQDSGYDLYFKRIDTAEEMNSSLEQETWDIIFSDFNTPHFNVPDTIRQIKEKELDLPFIIVSGTFGEEIAVEAMKAGAHDYLMKDNLTRLVPAVERELREAVVRQERRQAEEALKESEARFRKMSDSAQDAIIMMDHEGKISYWNKAAGKIFGYTDEEALGQNLHAFLTLPKHLESFSKGVYHFNQTGHGPIMEKTPELSNLTAVRKDGTEFPIGLSVSSVKIKGQWNAVGILRDVTGRLNLEEQLRQSQKMEAVGRLAGGIAHDFNNLLTAITGYAELLSMSLDPNDPLCKHVEEIKKAGTGAASLTTQLLTFSRRQILQPLVLNLNDSIENVSKMLVRLIGENIELITIPKPYLWWVKAEPGQIEQVILNLALNARDAMPQGGRLIIETDNIELDENFSDRPMDVKPGPHVMLTVSDTGHGMDEKTRTLIFEPFFSTKDRDQGTGLGLATVYGIIRQSGGYIGVYSEPGRGTTFKIYLPRVKEKAETIKPEPPTIKQLRGTETILLVEDDAAVRTMVCEILQRNGYNVLETPNPGEALLVSEQHTGLIHLLLSDVIMPRMNGPDLAERLASWHPEMKVLFMSGYTGYTIVNQGMIDPETAFIQKPFSTEALLKKAREVVTAPRQARH